MSPPHWWRVSAHHHPPRFDRQPLGTVPTLLGVPHPPELLAGLSCSSGLLVGRSSDENPGPSSSTSVSRFGDASSEPRDTRNAIASVANRTPKRQAERSVEVLHMDLAAAPERPQPSEAVTQLKRLNDQRQSRSTGPSQQIRETNHDRHLDRHGQRPDASLFPP